MDWIGSYQDQPATRARARRERLLFQCSAAFSILCVRPCGMLLSQTDQGLFMEPARPHVHATFSRSPLNAKRSRNFFSRVPCTSGRKPSRRVVQNFGSVSPDHPTGRNTPGTPYPVDFRLQNVNRPREMSTGPFPCAGDRPAGGLQTAISSAPSRSPIAAIAAFVGGTPCIFRVHPIFVFLFFFASPRGGQV